MGGFQVRLPTHPPTHPPTSIPLPTHLPAYPTFLLIPTQPLTYLSTYLPTFPLPY